MKIEELEKYADVLKYLEKQQRKKHLLLGNGFSMAYNPSIFSYNALNSFIENSDNDLLKKMFSIINTKNFELIMQQLDNFSEIAATFSTDKSLVKKINEASKTLKENLIEAVKELHPEHVFKVPEEESAACAGYIENYVGKGGTVFSTNYDLLLYWVLMRNGSKNAIDGFGRDQENPDDFVPEDERVYSELRDRGY
ncbi:predicted protein [Nematostella vectensis]|uniref:DUF4917 family protein n=1 Tax=Nematostella vectensis TaxID=45351 RepID=A7TCP5_NEMVE|nr:predicted protein [Nematostella vectensis]|eukprot:XP_001618269.1 hypothetical protein NEMVEDRAFT_v1g225324 [Nematostella vectensis]